MLDDGRRKKMQQALKRVEGQTRGIARMVGEGRYCIDILTQISAAEAALHRIGETVLRRHLETCVADSFRSGGAGDAKRKIGELMKVYARYRVR